MIAFVPVLLAKVTLIFAVGLALNAVLSRASASFRHLVLLATLVCGLTLPLAAIIAPRWNVAVLPAASPAVVAGLQTTATNDLPLTVDVRSPRSVETSSTSGATRTQHDPALRSSPLPVDRTTGGIFVWALGCLTVAGWLFVGRIRLRRIARNAWPLTATDWRRILDASRSEAGVTREVKLFSSSVVSTPLTWGTRTPIILLPEEALDWHEEHRRVVLRHEMAHIARGDSLVQLVAGFVCGIYWFHPLAWMIERRLRAECERACDDQVVSLGTPAADYAAHLLEVARSARSFGAPGFLSVAMARPSQLEGRLLAVLNESRQRVAASRTERLAAIAISVFLLLPLAAFRPVERSTPTQSTPLPQAKTLSSPASTANPIQKSFESKNEIVRTAGNHQPGSVTEEKVRRIDSTFTLSAPVRSGGTLTIDLKTGGAITIESWNKPEVFVSARLSGRNWRDTRVTLEPSNGDARLASDFTRWMNNQSTSHDFDIKLPREFNVRVKSSGGSISISNVSGDFSGSTGGGEITLRTVNGHANLHTGGGEIDVTDSNVNGSVTTGGGLVRIQRVNGNLRGSSGSGPVIYSESPAAGGGKGSGYGYSSSEGATAGVSASGSAYSTTDGGPIRMFAAGGPISLPSAPNGAHITTGGGKITIGSSGGAVYAQTGGGDIEIGPARGSVTAITGAGDIMIDFRDGGSVDAAAGVGRVVLRVPRDLNATLDLETAYTQKFHGKTRIISDWPLNVTETTEWDYSEGTPRRYVRVRQQVGRGGPLIHVKTVNGDIVLEKGS
ncbi:MAG TPA: M56 family metallopeptidase [Gemmatimonadaceae bacterium]|nr:M56 family metallopeptidase [Gemmatimonadaceae bacterium]